jgi:hypothetical protein
VRAFCDRQIVTFFPAVSALWTGSSKTACFQVLQWTFHP